MKSRVVFLITQEFSSIQKHYLSPVGNLKNTKSNTMNKDNKQL